LMATFESARVQTASRAVASPANALDSASPTRINGVQFGRKLSPSRVSLQKAGDDVVETMLARQLTYSPPRTGSGGAATSRRQMAKTASPPASPGAMPTTPCRSTAATATRSNTDQPVLCDARISTSSKAPPRSRHKSSPRSARRPQLTERGVLPHAAGRPRSPNNNLTSSSGEGRDPFFQPHQPLLDGSRLRRGRRISLFTFSRTCASGQNAPA